MKAIKVRPVLFNGAMVRALLDGRKTQTRRPVPVWQLPKLTYDKDQYISIAQRHSRYGFGVFGDTEESCMANYGNEFKSCCPFGKPGDLLYVRETWHENHTGELLTYRADWPADNDPFSDAFAGEDCCMVGEKWRPSIHMPRKASRLTLRITDVRVEKVSDISCEDAIRDGVQYSHGMEGYHIEDGTHFHADRPDYVYMGLWDELYGGINQWAWVLDFEVISGNVDQVSNETIAA
jgi:hypothetical protein